MNASDTKAFLGHGWAFPVAIGSDGEIAMVAYEERVRQSVLIILQTNYGERLMRPDFGANLKALVFAPLNTTTMALARHQVEQALILWEPRIDQIKVDVRAVPAEGKLNIEITYQIRRTNTFYNLVYPFYVREGHL